MEGTTMSVEVFARAIVDDFEANNGFLSTWQDYRQAIAYAEYWIPAMLDDAQKELPEGNMYAHEEYALDCIQDGIKKDFHVGVDSDGQYLYPGVVLTLEHRAERIIDHYVHEHRKDKPFPKDEHQKAYAFTASKLPKLLTNKNNTEEDIEAMLYGMFDGNTHMQKPKTDEGKKPKKTKKAKATSDPMKEDPADTEDEPLTASEDDEQVIIEVSQDAVKKALKQLTTNSERMGEKLKLYYDKHAEYNGQYFGGQLSHPLITIDKMSNRTLGNYTPGVDEMGIENHIRFNVNFVALNTDERVLETLRHEMIHQWQDEVLYRKKDAEPKKIQVPVVEREEVPGAKEPKVVFTGEWVETEQKKRPSARSRTNWHTREFKDMASVVGILADGPHCTGNPANMPQAKSYNRKFSCNCIASNGHRMTIWSTREVFAICAVCRAPYKELKKGGELVPVKQSHVEKPGENAIRTEQLIKYESFEHFATRDERDAFIEDLQRRDLESLDYDNGTYQKHHNAHKDGFTCWVAYTAVENYTQPEPPSEEPEQVERTYTNPVDLIYLYREYGALKSIAQLFGIAPGTLTYQKKKYNIDFGKGTYTNEQGETIQV